MLEARAAIVCQPEMSTWIERARDNRLKITERSLSLVSPSEILNFRRKVYHKASEFTQKCIKEKIEDIPAFSDRNLFIAVGHQPVIYHSGVARKNKLLSDIVRAGEAIGLNVIIDTDVGVAARLKFPQGMNAHDYRIGERVLSHGGDSYFSQRILNATRLREIFAEIKSLAHAVTAPAISALEQFYLAAADESVITAQTRIRRHFESHPQYLEIPLTELIVIPEAITFLDQIIQNGAQFMRHFNEELTAFRLDHKIKNHANPFPNLEERGRLAELPFWVINRTSGSRGPLFLNQDSGDLFTEDGVAIGSQNSAKSLFDWSHAESIRIAPRALLITALLRVLGSDYFIHGLGGARYDAFLDRLFESYWQIKAPHFAVVSETRYLFPELVRELEENEKLLSSAREIQFHLDAYLDNGTFPDELTSVLRALWIERSSLKERLIDVKRTGGFSAEITQSMKAVDAKIKTELGIFFSGRSLPSDAVIEALRFREFPFMYF